MHFRQSAKPVAAAAFRKVEMQMVRMPGVAIGADNGREIQASAKSDCALEGFFHRGFAIARYYLQGLSIRERETCYIDRLSQAMF